MKIKKQNKKNRLVILLMIFLFVFNSLGLNLLLVGKVKAQPLPVAIEIDPYTAEQSTSDKLKSAWDTWKYWEAKLGKHWAAVGFKAALHGFLRKLAIDSATWVASGDKGQKPMIFTSNWKEYMADAADEAAGTFIMASADQWDNQRDQNTAREDAHLKLNDDYGVCLEDIYYHCTGICLAEDENAEYDYDMDDYDICLSECRNERNSECLKIYSEEVSGLKDKDFGDFGTPTAGSAGARYGKGIAGSIVKFLCEPDFDIKMKITADLAEIQRPRKPRCTASRAMRNWDEFVDDPDFLTRFQGYWNPEDNDIGIALTMHNDLLNQMKIAQLGDAKGREEGLGFKAVTNKIGDILTPGTIVQEAIGLKPIKEGTKFESVFTGDIIADSIATFANTLMSKLINKWVMEGMAKLRGEDSGSSSDYNWISGVDSSASREAAKGAKGAKAAKAKYSKVFQPDYKVGGAYSILEKLLMCPDLENMGSTDCVITQPFADAINQELTVQQAIDEGYISVDLPFGFEADGMEPLYNQGYPYRSLIILRKYRIIPVGWELAARYIGDFVSNSSNARIYNIQEITDAFDDSASPFYQLIDPNWVLKAPELFCGLEGISEKIISEEISQGVDVNKDGDYDDESDHAPRINILREGYCADEKSCLMEDSKGNCLFYGYCSEEKRIWDFQGDKCESYYNTCQSFISPQGKQVSYLKNSLDYSGCDEDNAGCKWYCDSRNAGDGAWACLSEEWDLNLDKYCPNKDGCEILDSEDIDQDGDTLESCVVPHKGIECILDGSKARLIYNKVLVPNVNNDIYLNQKAESCSKSNEGCREYIRTKPNLGTNLITNSSFENIAEDDIVDDGIVDSFIEWPTVNGEASSASFIGNTAFKSLSATSTLTKTIDTGHSLEGRKFILSFYAQNCMNANFQFYIASSTDPTVKIASSTLKTISENNDDWERFSVSYNFPVNGEIKDFYYSAATIAFSGTTGGTTGIPAGCLIDAVQLEEVSGDGYQFSYEGYHNSNSLYLKKAPDYYHCAFYTVYKDDYDNQEDCEAIFNNQTACEDADYIWDGGVCIYSDGNRDPVRHFWRTDITRCVKGGSEQCANFALECGQGDVGCDLYTPINGDPSIPGVVKSDDFCPEDCNGYDTYKQEATFFESIKFPEFFIPNNEKKCSAQNAGCSEFTNLDKLAEGGEAVEYYTYLRPCHKIDSNCASFYTWVSSEETGFQIEAHLLLDANSDGIPDNVYSTTTASDIFGDCEDYDDAISNPECNEFYSESNAISYRHYKNTITCSDGCHPYRKTKSTATDCVIYSFAGWDWGEWSADNGCVYKALPASEYKQGTSCPSSQNNCYEYKGNTSHNVRKVIDDGFESAINNWGIGVGSLSSESLIKGGHSLKVNAGGNMAYPLKAECGLAVDCADEEGCECRIDDEIMCFVQKDKKTCAYKSLLGYQKTYFLSFWAKGSGSLTAKFSSAPAGKEFTDGSISLGPEWREYSLGPVLVDWDMDSDDPMSAPGDNILETLKISGFTGDSYIDNIILKEERDNLFLIRPDFWNVPPSCDQDHNSAYAPQYMLGCEEYKSEIDKETVFLKSFSRLCDEGVVGCEALIDTFNSYNYLEEIFNLADKSEITVFADKVDFLVNNKSKTCKERDKGCVALGIAEYRYNQNNTAKNLIDDRDDLYQYKTVYKINDPDKYSDTLCLFNDVGCGKFSSDSMGDYYFKDPVSQRIKGDAKICEYKMAGGQTTAGWYLTNTTSGEPNCPLAYSDVGVAYAAKTCLGGGGGICENNTDCPGGYCANWTGVCPSDADGCTEYIDPISSISKNIVFNGDWTQDVGPPVGPDGWHDNGSGDYVMDVPIYLEQDTVYTVMSHSDGASSTVALENCVNNAGDPINSTSPDDSMDVSATSSAQIISDENNRQFSGRFYTGKNSPISCDLRVSGNLVPDKFVKILKTGIYYNIDNSIDTGCVNIDYEKGCVLFNKREMLSDLVLKDIIYDADRNTKIENTPQVCSNATSTCDSNLRIKVKPTRTCGEWLYCKSKIKVKEDEKCTEIGLCNSIDNKGMCDGFVIEDRKNQTAGATISLPDIRDKSGYTKVGKKWNGSATTTIDGYYPFQEMRQKGGKVLIPNGNFEEDDSYPQGWISERSGYDGNYFSIINNPLTAQKNGLDKRAPEGKNFLKVGSDYPIISPLISLVSFEQGATYHISAYISTENLTTGSAQIQIKELDEAENVIINYYSLPDLSMDYSQSWQHKTASFKVASTTERISVKILAVNDPTGNFYIDDVKIKPVLHISDTDNYSPQTCRSYPKTSSLSCEYFDDAGIRNLGKYGYCLESDPANSSQCLMWWPVDLLLGEGIEEGAGYDGKIPVHYCVEAERLQILEYRERVEGMYPPGGEPYDGWCCTAPFFNCGSYCVMCPGYIQIVTPGHYCYAVPGGICRYDCQAESGWYDYDGFVLDEANYGVKFYNPSSGEAFDDITAYCKKIVQTVNSVGDNKYWSGRVFEGSGYIIPNLSYMYNTDYPPFGAILEPIPANKPYEWDGSDKDGIQPLYSVKDGARASHPYKLNNISGIGSFGLCSDSRDLCFHIDGISPELNKADCPAGDICEIVDFSQDPIGRIKRIFAQSYGTWKWDAKKCELGDRKDETCIDNENCKGDCGNYCYNAVDNIWGSNCTLGGDFACIDNNSGFCQDVGGGVFKCVGGCIDGEDCAGPADLKCREGRCEEVFAGVFECVGGFENGNNTICDPFDPIDVEKCRYNCFKCDNTRKFCGDILKTNCSADSSICDGTCTGAESGRYELVPSIGWMPPDDKCFGNPPKRPECVGGDCFICPGATCDWCGVPPIAGNIRVNKSTSTYAVKGAGLVNLTFNTIIDSEQLPLRFFTVDWGDGIDGDPSIVIGSGTMEDKPNPNNPHSMYHLYGYWDMLSKDNNSDTIECGGKGVELFGGNVKCPDDSPCCATQPGIKIKDNWDWCNSGTERGDCNDWEEYSGYIVVSQQQ